MMNPLSLAHRLTLFIGIIVTVVSITSTAYNYFQSRSYIREKTTLETTATVNKTRADLVNTLSGIEASTALLASVIERFEGNQHQLRELLKATILSNKNIYGSSVAFVTKANANTMGFAPYYYRDKTNDDLIYENLAKKTYNYQMEDWFLSAVTSGKANWSEPYFDQGGGNVLMTTYSMPVFKINDVGEKSLYAVVTSDISLNLINQQLQKIQLGDTGHAILISHKGLLLSYPETSLIMQSFINLLGDKSSDKRWQEVITAINNSASLLTKLPCIDQTHSNDLCMFGIDQLQKTGWSIAAIFPEDEMYRELHDYTVQFSFFTIAGILSLLIAIHITTRKLTHPLKTLSSASISVGSGNFDATLPKIYRYDEVGQLITAFKKMQSALKSYITRLESETASRSRLEGELSAAHQIQMAMLPGNGLIFEEKHPYKLWAKLVPAKSVGGDLYQFNYVTNEKLVFIVADVSDKGVAAALFMARTTSLLKQQFHSDKGPQEKIADINNILTENNEACMFVTLFYAELDLTTGHMIYLSAGHHSPILIRQEHVCEIPQKSGPALGLIEQAEYPLNNYQLFDDDKLFIYTDGVDEAFNEQGEMFGLQRLLTLLEENKHAEVDLIGKTCFDAITEFSSAAEQSDDITVMTLHAKIKFKFLLPISCHHIEEIHMPIEREAVHHMFEKLSSFAKKHAISDENLGLIQLIAEEILTNIIQYSCTSNEQDIYCVLGLGQDGLVMEFIDSGFEYNPILEAPTPPSESDEEIQIGGLGVHFVKTLSAQQAYQRKGRHNHLCVLCNLNQ